MTARRASEQQVWTVQALLAWTRRFFESKGIEGARLEAELLLAHALGWKRIDLYARFDHLPDEAALARFRELVQARATRVPAKYLIGQCEFLGHNLAVDPRVMIPRPETELLVEQALARLSEQETLVADLGTGSGAIAIAVAARRPAARLVATDLSPEALAVARENLERHGLADRLELRQGDWFEAFRRGETFDLIVSNPPYVAAPDLEGAMPEVRDHEPRTALDGGPDGLACLRVIVGGASRWLKPGGWLVVEIGFGQRQDVEALARETEAYDAVEVARDFQGIDRVVGMRKKS